MDRLRVAAGLGVVASLAVVATVAVVVVSLTRGDGPRATAGPGEPAGRLVVRDPRSRASFDVPAEGWRVEGPRVRIFYTDERDRPMAEVRGPAVYRAGYCAARPRGSNRAFAGFTRQRFGAWVAAIRPGRGSWSTGVHREAVRLADGTRARLLRSGLFLGGGGPCAADGVEVAMVRVGSVRVVLVRDSGERGGLPDRVVDRVLSSLRLADGG